MNITISDKAGSILACFCERGNSLCLKMEKEL